ncbi:PhnD/SsuA/transferrin family substrate-binding protein [Maliponia aquimaris]|uniref:Tetrathionate sensor histidine kinase TtrS n=1 Tax=Maliponia aquimaris TaxID=1673631 RepID=A0A238JN41_9RHOB|nr:PhnD/SsuA/transferrin family substrate-binding protein [Maliponia aquimaris]SMX32088.1 Tetrathionate sensor histidine kinase TtrS [Maliponia aquimaris]
MTARSQRSDPADTRLTTLARAALAALWLVLFILTPPARAQEADGAIVRVGILAHRGWTGADSPWTDLAAYLQQRLPGRTVRFVPVTLTSAGSLVNVGGLEFLVTNPGHYIDLARTYPLSVLATRKRALPDGSHTLQFGSAVLVRSDSRLDTLSDLRGARLGAVDPQAFGGFQIAWFEALSRGVDLFRDPSELVFYGFPQDAIVQAVLDGRIEAGIVRSGLLERLVAEGSVPPGALRALNANVTYTHPEAVSTRLYPEWPFLALAGTDPDLRDAVALALLQSGDSGLADLWGAPVSYHEARALIAAFSAREAPPGDTDAAAARFGWPVALAVVLLALLGAALVLRQRRAPPPPPDTALDDVPLTRRESQILAQIGAGRSTKEIAATLGISPKTVEFHRANLLRKFEARSSAQLIARAGHQVSTPGPET